VIHGEKILRANIANLKLALSDQNLELIPDYEQRIEVLQELKFIDENSTVLLKGRVACEVRSSDFSAPSRFKIQFRLILRTNLSSRN
jgi:antiviral helicase SKI2